MAAYTPIMWINLSKLIPDGKVLRTELTFNVSPNPTNIGTPTTPNVTGVELYMSDIITAAIGENPSPTSKGAQITAGVPNPATPSMNAPKTNPIMIAYMRLSLVILLKLYFILSIAPLSSSVYKINSAPRTIISILVAIKTPLIEAAIKVLGVIPHIIQLMKKVMAQAIGIVTVAGQLKPTKRIKITAMGIKAAKVYIIVVFAVVP